MKRIIPLLLTSLLLCSCGFATDRSNEVFNNAEIIGSTYFASVSATTNKEEKTVTLKYSDHTAAPAKITNYNGNDYDFEKEDTTKDMFSVKHTTKRYWYMFLVSLNEEDNKYMCKVLQDIIDEKTNKAIENGGTGIAPSQEVAFLTSYQVTGVAIGLRKTKYDNQFTDGDLCNVYAILGNYNGFYNGNIQYAKPGDSTLG